MSSILSQQLPHGETLKKEPFVWVASIVIATMIMWTTQNIPNPTSELAESAPSRLNRAPGCLNNF